MNNGDSFNPDDMEINFRETIEFFADENNNYSKKDLHDAFLVVTRLYLDELISMRNWENLIAARYGDDAAADLFEEAATFSPTVREGGMATGMMDTPQEIISSQFDLLEQMIGDNPFADDDQDPFEDDPE